MTHHYLACDLGAESGRLMLGTLQDGHLRMEELHRFPNRPVQTEPSLTWDIDALFSHLKTGLKIAGEKNVEISSISADAWGVDYVLADENGNLMSPAFHYRDPRTARGVERAHSKVAWEQIFDQTGIQFMPFNSLYQLMSEVPGRLDQADSLLGIGDAFNYLLSGVNKAEASFASTTQLYDPRRSQWADKLISQLELPSTLFPPIVTSGTVLGPLKPTLSRENNLPALEVVATCSHDTGAAVAAIPAEEGSWAYISSGTWSLMGVELEEPVITDDCRKLNYTNEVGFGGSIRLLKNIVGLWIIQECKRHWESNGDVYDYASLTEMAEEVSSFKCLIQPTDSRFLAPGDMPEKVASFCRETAQPAPETPGETIRCVLESLALLYRVNLEQIEQITGTPVERLHVVGGGSKNRLLNQLTANALNIPVLAGPTEATAAGNILIQSIALNHTPDLAAARQIVANSWSTETFTPSDPQQWEQALKRFRDLPTA